jgi:aminoglycoside 6-adenylyltransferase
MRNEQEMYRLILDTARNDERVRAVILNGSRANPDTPRDIFQDYDIVYLVTDVSSFVENRNWIDRFGERMILQTPDEIGDPPPIPSAGYTYLIQFMDGNRIDLNLSSVAAVEELKNDTLSVLLLDKDGLIKPFPPAGEQGYLPRPPTSKQFDDCCNEFWWVCPYVAKGLWRQEIIYARTMLDEVVRAELMKMLVWHIGIQSNFSLNPGKFGKYFQKHLEPGLWNMLLQTYAPAAYEPTWEALLGMCALFRAAAQAVASESGFTYPTQDDERVYAHLVHVRNLPQDALEIY